MLASSSNPRLPGTTEALVPPMVVRKRDKETFHTPLVELPTAKENVFVIGIIQAPDRGIQLPRAALMCLSLQNKQTSWDNRKQHGDVGELRLRGAHWTGRAMVLMHLYR